MNTIKSVYYGWGTLIVAGGGAYYFAKKSINADRAAKAQAEHEKRMAQYQLEQAYNTRAPNPTYTNQSQSNTLHSSGISQPAPPGALRSEVSKKLGKGKEGQSQKDRERADSQAWPQADEVASPSHEASHDPAPTRHEPEDEAQKMKEKSKYEASDVYRSRKGDRFS